MILRPFSRNRHIASKQSCKVIGRYDGDTDDVSDNDVVEKAVHHPLCHHSRRPTRSNHWYGRRVVIATVAASGVAFCRHVVTATVASTRCHDGTVIYRCLPY